MSRVKGLIAVLLAGVFVLTFGASLPPQNTGNIEKRIYWNFDDLSIGSLPPNWKVEATNQRGPLATWQVIEDPTALSGNKVLALTRVNHSCGGTFNLCWTKAIPFLNGEIKVKLKPNSGLEDQGGGVIWRARDRNNYYISRYNPLENNFRIYFVKNGERRMIASSRIHLPEKRWLEIKIQVQGNLITGFLNGKKLLEVEDTTFQKPGGVGLWTKSDAATLFDDFEVLLQP